MGNPAEDYILETEESSVDDYLAHYASPYYDPEKARQYYLRTRALKGRDTAKDLDTNTKKEAWAVTRSNLSKERQEEVKSARTEQTARLENLRTTATEARKRISEKLKQLLTDLDLDLESQIADKEAELQKKLESRLVKIPDTATPQRRAYLERQNSRIRKQYTESTEDEIQELKKEASAKATAGRKEFAAERDEIVTSLRSSLDKARTDYQAAREAAAEKYKSIEDREYENIRTKA